MVAVGDIKILRGGIVDGQRLWIAESSRGAGAVGATIAARDARVGRYDVGRSDLADGMADGVGDIEIACAVARHAQGLIELGSSARAVGGAG